MKKIIITVLGLGVIGCSTNQAPVQAPVVAPVPVAETTDNSSLLAKDTNNAVFFDFNKYNIKEQYYPTIQKNADYITASNNSTKVKVEGNTDDIGSIEYNLSLGQKRADVVKKSLIADGVQASQIEAVSNGKLKPVMSNADDSGQAYNRRSDIMYQSNPPSWYALGDGIPVQTNKPQQ